MNVAIKIWRDTAQVVRVLTWLSIILPVSVFTAAAYYSYNAHFDQARARAARISDVTREHAIRTFDIPKLARFTIDEILRGLSDSEITAREADLHLLVQRFAASFPQVEDIWVLDMNGKPLITAFAYPAPRNTDLSDREYYRVFRNGETRLDDVYVSTVLTGRHREGIFFQIAFARRDASGAFAGVTAVSVNPKYFHDFYEQLSTTGIDSIALVRPDGHVLARHPNRVEDLPRLPRASMFADEVAKNPGTGFYQGMSEVDSTDRLVAYRRVADYPAYAATGVNRERVISDWRSQLGEWALISAPATAFIFILCLLAGRLIRKEADALALAQSEMRRREASEEQIRQMQKMEAIGQLTGGIAHDFNNLLTIIIGSFNLMSRRMARGDTDLKQFVDAGMDGARRAATLVAQLLAFARKQPLDPKPTDVNRLLAGMSGLLQRTLGEQIVVETVQAGGLWLTNIDANQLENVIINLAVNARDAMPEGGKLTLEIANTYLDEDYTAVHPGITAGQYVVICVTDTGSGMTPEVAKQAFEPFFTTKESGRGTGLGLSQVYGFVKQSNGHVKIYSEIGHGTTVKIYMPRYIDGVGTAGVQRESAPVNVRGTETILLVEDEEGVRQFAKQALEELGYRVLAADGASMAMDHLKKEREIDLLLTDIVMPQMNGRRLAELISLERTGIKILYMTGYSRNAIIHNGVLDPGVALLNKPFTLDQLGVKVRLVLDA